MEHDSVILARDHLSRLKSWNQPVENIVGSKPGGEYTITITVIEGLLDYIEELERERRD